MKIFYIVYIYLNQLLGLSFPDKEFEKEFKKNFVQNNISQNTITLYVSLVAHIVYVGVSYYKTPNDFIVALTTLILIPILFSFVFLINIRKENFLKNIEFKLAVYGLVIMLSPLILLNYTQDYHNVYIINAMLPIFAVYTMYGSSFIISTFSAILMFFALSLSIYFIDIHLNDKIYYVFLLATTVSISGVSGYLIEKNHRKLYRLTYNEKKLNQEILKKEKLLQEQTRLAQMGEMISMIAHQWRQPLGAINSAIIGVNTKLESERYDLDIKEDRAEFLKFLNKKLTNVTGYVSVLSSTIDDFRNFFKHDKEKEDVSLTQPIEKALQILEATLSSNNIEVITNFQSDEVVSIYHNEMMQVILNILQNSEDNFKEKNIANPKIIISTNKIQNENIISIEDNGGGIPKDILTNIFDPYFSTKNEKNGSGLGLYMSKTIVEEHNDGNLIVENVHNSDNDCIGVIFKILLRNK